MTNINANEIQNEINNGFVTFDNSLLHVKELVENTLSSSPLIIRNYTKHLTKSNGKYIRAISLLTCAENKNLLIHPDAVKFAAAIEILHLATLVHDDVIDNADLRRGSTTLQKKYGKKTAVICGDYLFCMALNLAASVTDKEEYLKFDIANYMGRVCLGELNQHINNYNLNLSVYQYLKIISGKTAALFEASFYAGAILCKEEREDINIYKQLGQQIGMIFQLTDDCIDFEKTKETAKKPVQSDFEQGVITLPLIHAFEMLPDFKKQAKIKNIARLDINNAVKKSHGLGYTKHVSNKYYNKATKNIQELKASKEKKDRLIKILNKASGII